MIDTTVYPNHAGADLARDPLSSHRDERELKARRYYLDLAAKGVANARLICRTVYHLSGWYNRDKGGDVIGDHLSRVAREREGDESL